MSLGGNFWETFFRDKCIKRIEYYFDTLVRRILPIYENIEREAEKISKEKWDEYMSMPVDDSIDPSEIAEKAFDEGLEYFLIMAGQKQSQINHSTTVLYHLVEQHLLFFHRKQLLMPWKEQNKKLICFKELRSRLKQHNIDINTFSSWNIFEELRLVNNVVKHADGESANRLKKLRPDLFQLSGIKSNSSKFKIPESWVYLPMAGEDLYLSLEDVKNYKNSLISFTEEFIYAICSEK